jgi:hypothetical protein
MCGFERCERCSCKCVGYGRHRFQAMGVQCKLVYLDLAVVFMISERVYQIDLQGVLMIKRKG